MKKLYFILFIICLTTFGLVGCSSGDKAKGSEKEETKAKSEKKEESFKDAKEYRKLNEYMAEHTGGKVKVLHEDGKTREHDLDQLKVKLESYEVVSLKDVGEEFARVFDSEIGGRLVVARFTIHNAGKKDIYFIPAFSLKNRQVDYSKRNEDMFLPTAKQIAAKFDRDNAYVVKAGETVTGYEAYPLTEEVFSESTAILDVPLAMKKKDDYKSIFGTQGKFHISLNEKGAKKLAHNSAFYEDRVIAEDMGDKKMLKEKKGINEKAKLEDIEVTLNGYQFTKFRPNRETGKRFNEFKHGMVLLTAEFTIKNGGKRPVRYFNSTLHMNNKTQTARNEIILDNNLSNEPFKSGESRKMLQVYTLDEEMYEKILKEKEFEIEFGPLYYDGKGNILGKDTVKFPLPK
ncbi:DUF5068 domain-containing protein [Aciduricibacillus chroicocephali]|uniref:DUF5068 domain-containing protein n=1 Tax=Aciduricibacillus chroicocephali TaxID=3054939 RepID=A0ABY9KX57_9BACI|nr:DUF5068 domain-containing protein [Bacillaceae bacterium 44XB]